MSTHGSKRRLPRGPAMDTHPCAGPMQGRSKHQPQDAHGKMAGSSGGPGMSLGRGQLGLAGYESRLRCLKECRSELIRCSGCLTARKTPTARVSGEKKGGEAHAAPSPPPQLNISAGLWVGAQCRRPRGIKAIPGKQLKAKERHQQQGVNSETCPSWELFLFPGLRQGRASFIIKPLQYSLAKGWKTNPTSSTPGQGA